MDNIQRVALVAQLQARLDAPFEDDSNSVRDLTPDKARSLLAMFSDQIRKYGSPMLRTPTPRLVTAQRPFWERYSYKQHNGAQERARRRRQIERCQMRRSNGVLYRDVDGTFWSANSHGVPCPFYS